MSREDPLEKEMAPHSSILAWKIPWTEESEGIRCIGSQRVRHDLVTEQACNTVGTTGPDYHANLERLVEKFAL